jgi:hypothetical protein
MDILAWLWWLVVKVLGSALSVVWFLVGGWVSTLAQIAVVLAAICIMKFGWRRSPQEILSRASRLGRFFWAWLRAREPGAGGTQVEVREVFRTVRMKEFGDVNLSTLLSLAMLAGLGALAVT